MSEMFHQSADIRDIKLQDTPRVKRVLLVCFAAGMLLCLWGAFVEGSGRAWQSLLVNTMFLGGISFGGILFSIMLTLTHAVWGRPLKRAAESMAAFIPLFFICLLILFFGLNHIFEWTDPDLVIPEKSAWLDPAFFVVRHLSFFCIAVAVTAIYLRAAILPDVIRAGVKHPFFLFRTGKKEERSKSPEREVILHKANVIAPFLAIIIIVLMTMQAFDWILSIDQEWHSTLFGVHCIISGFLGTLAVLLIVSGFAVKYFPAPGYFTPGRHQDLARLVFAASLFLNYLIFSQILVIWYGDIPNETAYLVLRMKSEEWGFVFKLLVVLLFITPFLGLLSRRACRSISVTRAVGVIVLAGLWLEKYILIVPSVQEYYLLTGRISPDSGLPGFQVGLYEIAVTLSSLSAFLFCMLWMLQKVPLLPLSDPLLKSQMAQTTQLRSDSHQR